MRFADSRKVARPTPVWRRSSRLPAASGCPGWRDCRESARLEAEGSSTQPIRSPHSHRSAQQRQAARLRDAAGLRFNRRLP